VGEELGPALGAAPGCMAEHHPPVLQLPYTVVIQGMGAGTVPLLPLPLGGLWPLSTAISHSSVMLGSESGALALLSITAQRDLCFPGQKICLLALPFHSTLLCGRVSKMHS